jgi:DNA-binding NarL/FixJ family response regulator
MALSGVGLAMILRFHGGFRATAFTHSTAALRAARLIALDLLISVMVMPELSGIDPAIQVKQRCPDYAIAKLETSGW